MQEVNSHEPLAVGRPYDMGLLMQVQHGGPIGGIMNLSDRMPFSLADLAHEECCIIEEFVGKVRKSIFETYINQDDEYVVYHGAIMRIVAQLRSLAKMNHPGDFQAVSAASRSLFEIAVDFSLLTLDGQNHPIDMISSWEESAKLDRAEKMVDFYSDHPNLTKPDFYSEMGNFITTKGTTIRNNRRRADKKHDNRWTGRDLRGDAAKVDKIAPHFKFEEFYVLRYAPLCWNTHGSGLAAVKFISTEMFPAICAIAFNECARFALISTKLLARKYGCSDLFDSEYDKLEKKRGETRLLVLQNYPEVLENFLNF